jgi:hypothetical protein
MIFRSPNIHQADSVISYQRTQEVIFPKWLQHRTRLSVGNTLACSVGLPKVVYYASWKRMPETEEVGPSTHTYLVGVLISPN